LNTADIHSIFAFTHQGETTFKKFTQAKSAYAYYAHHRINLLTGKQDEYSITLFCQQLDHHQLNKSYPLPVVLHLFYEFRYLTTTPTHTAHIPKGQLLAVEIYYQKSAVWELPKSESLNTYQLASTPCFERYQKAYQEAYNYLLEGECYQLNLSYPFTFTYQDSTPFSCDSLLAQLWRGPNPPPAYAHATTIPALNRALISNSPEGLFQIKHGQDSFKLCSMPIKGTIPTANSEDSLKQQQKLARCSKNEAELFMITDLMRNDLSSIEQPTAKVVAKRRFIQLPSLIHQYSLVAVDLSFKVTLGRIIKAIFPGGSITGAPKRRTIELLYQLEELRQRGFSYGSTILLYKETQAASINIRSMEVNLTTGKLTYQAGGGITLLSRVNDEYQEMKLKVKSGLANLLQTDFKGDVGYNKKNEDQ
jgi:para-aminobenzoate synthetase component I